MQMPVLCGIFHRRNIIWSTFREVCGAIICIFGHRWTHQVRLHGRSTSTRVNRLSYLGGLFCYLQVCRDVFDAPNDLDQHERRHKHPGGFGCSVCNETFLREQDRVRHCEDVHQVNELFTSVAHSIAEYFRSPAGIRMSSLRKWKNIFQCGFIRGTLWNGTSRGRWIRGLLRVRSRIRGEDSSAVWFSFHETSSVVYTSSLLRQLSQWNGMWTIPRLDVLSLRGNFPYRTYARRALGESFADWNQTWAGTRKYPCNGIRGYRYHADGRD